MTTGYTIKMLRTAAGLRQSELAKEIGITASYLSLIENDSREPSLSTLKQIGKALNVPISVLVFESSEPSGNSSADQVEEFHRIQDLTMQILKRLMSTRPSKVVG